MDTEARSAWIRIAVLAGVLAFMLWVLYRGAL